ncbi:MAG: primosomal protein N', partial [Deltaproteobacteria bacterium]|nr:primosomal protein N' [Deltaproteobacteria bacterium]
KRGIQRFITPELESAMRHTLARGEQVLLFLNRRGYANHPVCCDCGDTISCKNCDISLTLHRHTNALKCHYCGLSRQSTTTCPACGSSPCPACGSSRIRLLGLGTEKVEAGVARLFPKARIARLDKDTTARKGSLLKVLKGLKERTVDILVGTQMVAKGHDFPNITLVGVICADSSLSLPDFRAGERTFQLLAQVAGRAGRGDVPGKVVMQTYNPEHFSILSARAQNFEAFYDHEIQFRNLLNYPPFSRLVQLRVTGRDSAITRDLAQAIGQACRERGRENPVYAKAIEVLGPIEAPISRIAGRFRWQILIKSKRVKDLNNFVRTIMTTQAPLFNHRRVTVAVDVDPLDML